MLHVLLGLELGNIARDPTVVTESLRSSWGNLFLRNYPGFGNTQQRGSCTAHAASSDPGWAFQGIREGFCKGVAAKISCVRARWQRHSRTLVTFKWELGKIYQKLGKCWLIREEKCFVARAGE